MGLSGKLALSIAYSMSDTPLDWPRLFSVPSLADWEAVIRKELKQAVYEETLHYTLPGGQTLPAAVSRANARILSDLPTPGFPGWELVQGCTLPDDAELLPLNQTLLFLLEHGAEALSFRLPYAEVFAPAVAPTRDYQQVLETALQGVFPGYIRLHFYAGMQSEALLDALAAWMQRHGHDTRSQRGIWTWDPLSLGMWRGQLDPAHQAAYRAFAGKLAATFPAMTLAASNAYLLNACGANPVQELAMGLATLFEQGPANRPQGIRLAAGRNFLLEIAKFRAVPVLWQRLAPRYAPHLAAQPLEVLAATSLWNQAVTDPYNNLVRNTLQAMAAVLGGAQAVEVQPHNVLFEKNDPMGMRLAKNIQLLFKEESHLAQVADPARGAYVIESLTTSIVDAAEAMVAHIQQQGGMTAVVRNGWAAQEINGAKERFMHSYAQQQEVAVGVNKYVTSEPRPMPAVFNARVATPDFPTITPIRLS